MVGCCGPNSDAGKRRIDDSKKDADDEARSPLSDGVAVILRDVVGLDQLQLRPDVQIRAARHRRRTLCRLQESTICLIIDNMD